MKNNIDDINGWLYHRIRMCIWKQWKKPRTKYKNLVKLGIPEHYAATIANSRRKYWYISNNKAVIWALNKERLINSGFYDLATAYQSVHVNYWKRRIPNGTYGAVRGRRLVTASYSIKTIKTVPKIKKINKIKKISKNCWHIYFYLLLWMSRRERVIDTRKCRNWQTSKTKDLVFIANVWVQVPSSASKDFFEWRVCRSGGIGRRAGFRCLW